MKKILSLLLMTLLPFQAIARNTVLTEPYPWLNHLSGSAAIMSNYIFRGVSQTKNLMSAQVSLTYTTPVNVYLNLWAANASFINTNASIETDTIIGYRNHYGEHFNYDLSIARYFFLGAEKLSYNEFNALGKYYFFQALLGYSANAFNSHHSGTYYNVGINYDIPDKWLPQIKNVNLIATIGHYSLSRAAGNSYNDYNIQIAKSFKIFQAVLQWTSTDGRQHYSPYANSQIDAQIIASF